MDGFAFRILVWKKKGFNQFALATHNHSGKSFKPFSLGNLGIGYQATLRIDKLLGRDLPFLYALQQMLEKGWRYIGSPNLRHRLDSVKTTRQTFFEPRRFFRIGSLR